VSEIRGADDGDAAQGPAAGGSDGDPEPGGVLGRGRPKTEHARVREKVSRQGQLHFNGIVRRAVRPHVKGFGKEVAQLAVNSHGAKRSLVLVLHGAYYSIRRTEMAADNNDGVDTAGKA
jgi:hypothetical protein